MLETIFKMKEVVIILQLVLLRLFVMDIFLWV